MRRYKFQALVTLGGSGNGKSTPIPAGQVKRFVLRGHHYQTHDTQMFSALVSNNGEAAPLPEADRMIVTVALVGEEPREYFDIGAHFSLWRGQEVGSGIVTRRLFF